MGMTTTNTDKLTQFATLWISVGASATVDENRRISAEGHKATMARLAAQSCPYGCEQFADDDSRCDDCIASARSDARQTEARTTRTTRTP